MRILAVVARIVVMLLKAITFEWIAAIVEMVRRFIDRIRAWFERSRLPHPDRNSGAECLTVDHPAVRRPDPCIYSQAYLTQLGLPVTWDNPDIILLRNGIPVPEFGLQPGTLYEIQATIWNNSFTAPVIGMPVEFSFLTFGVATTSTPIGTTMVNVGAKGTVNHPATTRIPWVTPATGGHFCIQASFAYADDVIPENNVGQNNVDVALAQSPAHFTFQLRNARERTHRYTFIVDTYTPLELPECDTVEPGPLLRSARIDRTLARHAAANIAVPPGWTIVLSPTNPTLDPGEEITIQADVTPPAGFTGDMPFNVNAYADGTFAGGVTLVARAT